MTKKLLVNEPSSSVLCARKTLFAVCLFVNDKLTSTLCLGFVFAFPLGRLEWELAKRVFFEATHEKLHYLVISDPRALLSSIH